MKEDILDRYALNQLSDKDRKSIKQALDKDPNLQKELDLHKDIVKGMQMHVNSFFDNQLLLFKIKQVDAELEEEGFFENYMEETSLEKDLIKNIQVQGEKELKISIKEVDAELEKEGFFEQKTSIEEVDAELEKEGFFEQKTSIKEVGAELEKEPAAPSTPIFSLLKISIAAASILLVLTLTWQYLTNNSSPTEQYAQAFELYENILTKPVTLELSEGGFAGKPKEEPLQQLLEAMNAYDTKNYSKTSQMLKALLQKGIDGAPTYITKTQLYLALSYMAQNNIKDAIPLLQDLSNSNSNLKEISTWYLALAELKEENIGLAKTHLEKLKKSEVYGQRTNNLLESL